MSLVFQCAIQPILCVPRKFNYVFISTEKGKGTIRTDTEKIAITGINSNVSLWWGNRIGRGRQLSPTFVSSEFSLRLKFQNVKLLNNLQLLK